MNDQRRETIKQRLMMLSSEERQRIRENIDRVCFDTFNYDEQHKTFCPLAVGMGLHLMESPSDGAVKTEIAKRFFPVNVLKGVPGEFYRDSRKQDLLQLLDELT